MGLRELTILNGSDVGTATADDGEIFNDYVTNKALAGYSHSEGSNNIAGCKGFKIISMTTDTSERLLLDIEGNASSLSDVSIESNRIARGLDYSVSFQWGNNYDLCCNISSVGIPDAVKQGVTKVVLNKPTTSVNISLASSGYLWIPTNPEIGNISLGTAAHSEGYGSYAVQTASHTEGGYTLSAGKYSHTEGRDTIAVYTAHAEGNASKGLGHASHAEGYNTKATAQGAHAEGGSTLAEGKYSHAEGFQSNAIGQYSHAEGSGSIAQGELSHAEGRGTQAQGPDSHTEGNATITKGHHCHAEGNTTVAEGNSSHSEGHFTNATGEASHAEGCRSASSGTYSHAEGVDTQASGTAAHAGGRFAQASGDYSIAHGDCVRAVEYAQCAVGKNNKFNNTQDVLFMVGNGETTSSRSNAFEVYKDGSLVVGGVKITPEQLTKLLALLN